ncbi:hypothetical protein Q8F55_005848 [Vanrija albida]|uniref:BRCT domain-containing protein n=1 Tax=Vanrija albida TaxID=181172 RepID=A0ABR3Q2S8_9TREE
MPLRITGPSAGEDQLSLNNVFKGCRVFVQSKDYPGREKDIALITKHGGQVVRDPVSDSPSHVIVSVPDFKPRGGQCYQHTVASSSKPLDRDDWGLDALLETHTMGERPTSQPVVVVEQGWVRACIGSRLLLGAAHVEGAAFGGWQVRGISKTMSNNGPSTRTWIKRAPIFIRPSEPMVTSSPPPTPASQAVPQPQPKMIGFPKTYDTYRPGGGSRGQLEWGIDTSAINALHIGVPEPSTQCSPLSPAPTTPSQSDRIEETLKEAQTSGDDPAPAPSTPDLGGKIVPKDVAYLVVLPLDFSVRATEPCHRDIIQKKGVHPVARAVSHDWVWDCFKNGTMTDIDAYIVKLAGTPKKRRSTAVASTSKTTSSSRPSQPKRTRTTTPHSIPAESPRTPVRGSLFPMEEAEEPSEESSDEEGLSAFDTDDDEPFGPHHARLQW